MCFYKFRVRGSPKISSSGYSVPDIHVTEYAQPYFTVSKEPILRSAVFQKQSNFASYLIPQ